MILVHTNTCVTFDRREGTNVSFVLIITKSNEEPKHFKKPYRLGSNQGPFLFVEGLKQINLFVEVLNHLLIMLCFCIKQ